MKKLKQLLLMVMMVVLVVPMFSVSAVANTTGVWTKFLNAESRGL
ncbi:hypothetical protein [Paenibacillus hemerocallicola]|nr:hypothetical protein [Paenibacillus hemerocallicola]